MGRVRNVAAPRTSASASVTKNRFATLEEATLRYTVRLLRSFIVLSAATFVVSACTSRSGPDATASPGAIVASAAATGTPTPEPTALPPVSAAPKPTLPAWILSISPTGEAKDGAQIRIRFASDLVPVEALESPDRSAALAHFVIEPALPGRFILLTPRMVAFQADAPVPHATRVRVTLTAGLADLAKHRLASDLAWSFTTQPIQFSNYPDFPSEGSPAPLSRTPRFGIDVSDAVNVDSLLAHVRLTDATDRTKVIALHIAPSPSPDPSASPSSASDASGSVVVTPTVHYDLVPSEQLAYDRKYEFTIGAGILSAAGNLPTQGALVGYVRTFGPLTFTGQQTNAGPGARFGSNVPSLQFSNPLDEASVSDAVTISPAPAKRDTPLLTASDGISIDENALAPETTYTVKIGANLRDSFGQTLGRATSTTFRTSSLVPNIAAPAGSHIFPADLDLALDVSSVNLPDRAFQAGYVTVRPRDVISHDLDSQDGVSALLPPTDAWKAHPLAQVRNLQLDTALPIRKLAGGPVGTVAYGIRAKTVLGADGKWTIPEYYGAVAMTNLGVLTQWFPGGGLVRVRHLGDGTPVPGAAVDVYESHTEYGAPAGPANEAPCASGTTASDGTWRPGAEAWAACASTATTADRAPALVTIVRFGADWAYARSSSYENGYGFGLSGDGWSAGTPHARGSLVSDRTLYQPGETAKFVGISYFETNGTIGRGKSQTYDIVVTSPSGAKQKLASEAPDAFGAFSVSFDLPKNAPVGAWQIDATGQGGETISGSFTVAEFKPPNFKVDLSLDERPVAAGASVPASSQSLYLFGAPVQGGTSRVSVTRSRAYFAPDGFESFSFGRMWTYPEEEPTVSSDVLQQALPIDASGNAATAVPVGTDLPFPMTYTVTTETTDVSNLAVAATKSFLALPSDASIGLRSPFVAVSGAALDVDAVVVGLDGKARAGRDLKLILQQRVDASATQIVEGSEAAHDAVRYVDVATQTVTSAEKPVQVAFTPPKAGEYRVRANFADATSDVTASDTSLWVTGAGEAAWFTGDSNGLGVKLDKTTYRPGDVAHVLVQSPYPEAEMYLAVVRHGAFLERTALVHGAAPEASFTVTKDMLPNAAVQIVLVRRGRPLSSGVPTGLDKLASTGFAPFEVALDGKYLHVDVAPQHATVEPGGRERLALRLRAADGSPVRGELTVAVVNDAILQLSGYRFPDLVKSVYADEPISTRLADNYGDVELRPQSTALDKGYGYGGGVMAGPASTRVRTKFLPLAYWNAAVRTDANGNASVEVPLPDDLTTWRVMALALTSDARFGNGEATFVATKPLVTDPILPQFARVGDRFDAGVSVTNVAHASGALDVRASVSGGAALASGATSAATSAPASAAGSPTQAYRFAVVADAARDASFTFRSTLGSNADAFTFGVPIVTDDVLESAITTGTTENDANVPVDVAASLRGPLGGLDVTLASTLLAEALEPTNTLATPHIGFGTELASRIAVASDAIVLDRRYGRTDAIPRLNASVATDLAALRALALPDGGFAQWPGAEKSEVFTTAFDVVQLVQARDAGFAVGPDLAHAMGYLRKALADPYSVADLAKNDTVGAAEVRLEALETLGTAGEVRNDFLDDIWKNREKFEYYERVELARFLVRLPAWHALGISLRDELFTQVALGARHATVDVRGEFGESEPAGQAQMLGLAIESGTPKEDVDRLLESLLALRHDGTWGCVFDDAEAMNGLVVYAGQDTQPPDFVATATLPANPPRTVRRTFRGYAVTTTTDTIPTNDLARGAGRVTLVKSGRGTLHYVVALRYRVPDESPGIYQGLRIDRILRAPGDPTIVATFGLPLPAAPTSLGAARVFDVEDRIVTDHPVENVLVTDPLPAGFEAVDQSFRTSAPVVGETDDSFSPDYTSIYRSRVVSFVSHLDPGAYAIHYLVRSVTPGRFSWPGAVVQLQYEPEEFGRTSVTQLIVTP